MLAANKTKLVCTIGPASESPAVLAQLLRAGMNIARLNFSHGDFSWHAQTIERLRAAARETGMDVTIMADLPGPKIRVGQLAREPLLLKAGDPFVFTTDTLLGDARRVSVSFPPLPSVVKRGDHISMNDGNIHLEVESVTGNDVACRLLVGGELRSRKGVNLPGIDLGISAFTEEDHACLAFALEHGVDAVSQSFVAGPDDVVALRQAAKALGHEPFVIAKIERSQALDRVADILRVSDGIMIARGDLGVEIPLERIAVVQKELTSQANLLGKPVITATQMLESMVTRSRPTRAEVTDVANAILDGTDCVMLSEESAMGRFPVQATAMLAKIAAATEPQRNGAAPWERLAQYGRAADPHLADFTSRNVQHAVKHLAPVAVIVPTASGHTARMISRFRIPLWIGAISIDRKTCRNLSFSYGVHVSCQHAYPENWDAFARQWVRAQGLQEGLVVLIQGPSPEHPEANPSIEIITLVEG